MRLATTLLATITILGTTCVHAQQNRERENVMGQGTVKGVRPGFVAVTSEQGQQWVVKVPDRPQSISFVASAHRNWLRPNMLVKFKNTFDAKGKPVALVRQLEVITLRPDTKLGLIPDSRLAAGGGGLFSNDEPSKRPSAPETMSFTVAGKLRALKDDKILVAAGTSAVQSQLDENATISVDISDYSLAREGDTVRFQGWYYLGFPDRVIATQLSISSKEKLGAEQTKGKKPESKDAPDTKDDVEKSLEDLFSS